MLFAKRLKAGDPTFNKDFAYRVVNSALRNLQNIYLKDTPYINGTEPSIADLIAIYDVAMLEVLEFDYSKYPKVIEWMQRVKKIKEVQEADSEFQKNTGRLREVYRENAKL